MDKRAFDIAKKGGEGRADTDSDVLQRKCEMCNKLFQRATHLPLEV